MHGTTSFQLTYIYIHIYICILYFSINLSCKTLLALHTWFAANAIRLQEKPEEEQVYSVPHHLDGLPLTTSFCYDLFPRLSKGSTYM